MGFLEAGTPLSWPASLEHIPYVRKHGILQFLHTFHRVKHRQNDVLKWGDEIEYHLVRFFDEERRTAISLTAPELVHALEAQDKAMKFPIASAWRPEYGSWMVEATPGAPYGGDTSDLRRVEVNMAMRRYRITALCPRGVVPVSIVNYPLLGAPGVFTDPPLPPGGPFSRSAYVPDACISPHPRFGTLTANIRKRRGRKVPIQMPLFMDAKTQPGAAIAAVDAAPGSGAEGSAAAAALAGGPGGGLGAERAAALAAAADDASSRLPEAAVFAGGAEAHARATGDWDADTSVGPAHAPEPQHIHMDAMVFGMGCCCLQVTFQARDLAESRYLYDQLHVLSPLMMALTANAPIWRGHLADTDTRWDVIAASVDCRTPQERGCCCPSAAAAAAAAAPDSATPGTGCGAAAAGATAATISTAGDGSAGAGAQATPAAGSANHYDSCLPSWMALPAAAGSAGGGVRPISKSRYSSIDCFISASPLAKEGYNDVPLAYDEEACAVLREAGVDERLSRHIAHLFVRDPLVIFKERIALDDALSSEHFENIQSTNWRSVRWKPPPPDAPDMGWRVELRTMEAQVTDFENAAFTVFVVLLSRVILSFDLNLYIPLSKVDANFERARQREAASKQTFYFRKHVMRPGGGGPAAAAPAEPSAAAAAAAAAGLDPEEDAYAEMSAAEILLGRGPFPGLIPLIFAYLDVIECDAETRTAVDHYLRFVAGRATGEIQTGASWQRAFVAGHPEYRHDSVVPPSVVYDMLQRLDAIAAAREAAPSLLGPLAPLPITVTESALSPPPPAHGTPVAGAAGAVAGVTAVGADAARGPLSPSRSAAGHSSPATPASPAEQALAQQRLMAAMRTYEALAAGPAEGGAAHATGREPAAAPATAAAAAAAGGAGLGVKMRGRSFAEEIAAPTHPVIRRLLERFTLRDDGRSFADVPAFLGSP